MAFHKDIVDEMLFELDLKVEKVVDDNGVASSSPSTSSSAIIIISLPLQSL